MKPMIISPNQYLNDLRNPDPVLRKNAAYRLSKLRTSSLDIVRALQEAWKTETCPKVRRILRKAMTAEPHYQLLAMQPVKCLPKGQHLESVEEIELDLLID